MDKKFQAAGFCYKHTKSEARVAQKKTHADTRRACSSQRQRIRTHNLPTSVPLVRCNIAAAEAGVGADVDIETWRRLSLSSR